MACIDTSSIEYQTLKNRSGVSDFMLDAYCLDFLDTFDRYPRLDEIPGVDSSKEFAERFLVKDESAKVLDVLNETNSLSIAEAVVKINSEYADQETEMHLLLNEVLVLLRRRPTLYGLKTEPITVDRNTALSNNGIIMSTIFDKLEQLYGISIVPITSEEISLSDLSKISEEISLAKAFVYDNKIYVNTDFATVDSPLHELMHIFLGSIRFTNPNLYSSLVQECVNNSNVSQYLLLYPNRTQNDLGEEIFVSEFSKYLLGLENMFSKLDDSVKYDIFYSINRVLDTILFGDVSVKAIADHDFMSMSLIDLAQKVNSATFNNTFRGSLDDASIHRMLANKKLRLLESNELKEICD